MNAETETTPQELPSVGRGELALVLAWMRAFAAETQLASNQHEYDIAVFYQLLRARPPDVYIELGRGKGSSTLLAAQAMAANGCGSIISYDLAGLTAHDLLDRLRAESRVAIDLRVGDIRDLVTDDWQNFVSDAREVAVLVDAHEETGAPVSEVLLPFVRSRPDIGWRMFFHDVLYVPDRALFGAFAESYMRSYPFVSPYPEYGAIFPALEGLGATHYARFMDSLSAFCAALEIPTAMTNERARKHRFVGRNHDDDVIGRFGRLARSATLLVDLPAAAASVDEN